MRIGVDTGGTFTDFVWTEGGQRRSLKLHSTADDPARAVLDGISRIAAVAGGAIEIVYGTTVATNALLTRCGARVLLFTTAGMEDVLEIGRQDRPELYSLRPVIPPPLVPKQLRAGIAERLGPDGGAIMKLSSAEIERVVAKAKSEKPDAVAICLLYSYINSEHELALANALAKTLKVPVFTSCELDPYPREYERTSTTVIHAYLSRAVESAIASLTDSRARKPLNAELRLSLLTSSGGTAHAAQAIARPADLVLSGPAGGAVGAAAVAARAGARDFIGLDMGGTSTDVCLGLDGRVLEDAGGEIAGFPLRVPRLGVHTIGAGGGSIARAGAGGALVVGPESAGADPGPAAYGKGDFVTVTDANLALGRLPDDILLGGHTALDAARSRKYIARLAKSLSLSPEDCARGIIRIADEKMAQAVRKISQVRGYDPRGFTLVPFGGAGALHACGVAELLGMTRILVPTDAGCLSALGACATRPRRDAVETVMLMSDDRNAAVKIGRRFNSLAKTLSHNFDDFDAVPVFRDEAMCRYPGQSYELAVVPARGKGDWCKAISDAFHAEHERNYGYARPEMPVEIVALKVTAEIALPDDPGLWSRDAAGAIRVALPGGKAADASILKKGLRGPASIVDDTATCFVAHGWTACRYKSGHVWMERAK